VDDDDVEIIEDYLCRYYPVFFVRDAGGNTRRTNRDCSCCGHFYKYIEQGTVCTRFCAAADRKYEGLEPLIRLPFNWGDQCPDEIYLGDKETEVPDLLKKCEDLMEGHQSESVVENHSSGKHLGHSHVFTATTASL